MSSAPVKARISFKVGSSIYAFVEENELGNWISLLTSIVASGTFGGEVRRREALLNRIFAHQVHRYVGMDEILLEEQQELEERVDRWLNLHEKDAS